MSARQFTKLVLGTAISGLLFSASAHAADQVIKLGFAAPLTGPQAHYGEDMQHGILLAIKEANAKKLQIDGKTAVFKLISRDDQADPKTGVQVAQQLVDEGIVGMLGHFNSGTTIPASRVYNDAGIPEVSMATAPQYTAQGFNTTFRMMTNDNQAGAAAGEFIVKNLNAKKIAIIDDRTAYGQGLAEQVKKAAIADGAQVISQEYTTDKATDFATILTNIKAAKPDAIFYGGLDAQSGPMRRQMKELGLSVPLVSGEMTRSDTFIKLAGNAANGTYASLAGVPLEQMTDGKGFANRFKTEFKTEPGTYAPYAYDGAWNMITAIEQANSADPAKYLPKLAALKRSGATSANISYTKSGDLNEISVTVYEVKDNKWVPVKTITTQVKQ